ncbi:MAG: MarC family protein, partial [Petrimonas sp.]|nr:MarC family protein [Petrimonas sp.]
IVIAMAFAIVGLNYLAFRSSEFIVAKLGNNVIMVIDKIMGLILAIIWTGMVISGVKLIA